MSLTNKQEKLVAIVSDGLSRADMAAACGYADGNIVSQQLANPRIQAAIRTRVVAQLQGEIVPEAVKTLRTIMLDTTVKPSTRVDAAKTLLDRAGLIAPKARDPDKDQAKDPSEMSQTELVALIERLEREKSERAVPVNGEPNDAPTDAKPLSFLD